MNTELSVRLTKDAKISIVKVTSHSDNKMVKEN